MEYHTIDNWKLSVGWGLFPIIEGNINGHRVSTSQIKILDLENNSVSTVGTINKRRHPYKLGTRDNTCTTKNFWKVKNQTLEDFLIVGNP